MVKKNWVYIFICISSFSFSNLHFQPWHFLGICTKMETQLRLLCTYLCDMITALLFFSHLFGIKMIEWQIWWDTNDDPLSLETLGGVCQQQWRKSSVLRLTHRCQRGSFQRCAALGLAKAEEEEEPVGAASERRSHFRAQMATQQWGGRTWESAADKRRTLGKYLSPDVREVKGRMFCPHFLIWHISVCS